MTRYTRLLVVPALVLMLGVLGAAPARAAQVKGIVVATGYYTFRVVVAGELPSWVKKHGSIGFLGMQSLVTDIKADTIDIGSANAGAAKPGDVVILKKWKKGRQGC